MSSISLRHGFRLLRTEELPDHNGVAYFYEHAIHKCPFIHISTNETNNNFSIAFKTTCANESGANHVLEHMVLHGSEKYPVSDVFQELLKRSLANLLNAFTGLDYTMYPFSTTNEKDFHNIMEVYLDAAFHPNLNEDNFLTECHRLEQTDLEDPNSPLKHSGVVYSEMCGVLSNPSDFFSEKVRMTMMPDTPYKYVFGGDPEAIARLTLDQLKEYHKKYYSPSNCYLFHFGNFPLDPIMERVNSFLSAIEPTTDFALEKHNYIQKPFLEPIRMTIDGPIDPMCEVSEQFKSAISWHLCNLNDVDTIQDFEAISTLLMDSIATLLHQRLIKTQIGSNFTSHGVETSTPNVLFSIGLEHLEEENVEKFEEIVFATLKEIVQNGFKAIEIESVLHQLEMSVKTVSSDPGSNCLFSTIDYWVNGVELKDVLNDSSRIRHLKERIDSTPHYLESQIQKYLLDNKSRAFLTVRPVPGFAETFNEQMSKSINQDVSIEERERIRQKSKQVRDLVTKEKPLHLLPAIHLSDIDPIAPKIDFTVDEDITTFPMFTNGVVYIKFKVDLPMDDELISDASLLANVMGGIGCGEMDDQMFSEQENLYTSGILCTSTPFSDKDDPDDITASFFIQTAFLMRNMENAVNLVRLFIEEPFLDNKETIHSILNSIDMEMTSDFSDHAANFAESIGGAQFSRYYALYELWNGITFVDRIQEVKDSEECEEIVKAVYEQLFKRAKFSCSIVADPENIEKVKEVIVPIVNEMNQNTDLNATKDFSVIDEMKEAMENQNNILFEFETMVNSTNLIIKSVPFSSPLSVSLCVLAELLQNDLLHIEIREKLGAYGVFCGNSALTGQFNISSYRDTSAADCLKAYRSCLERVAKGEFDNEMIERAIIGLFSVQDRPLSPKKRSSLYSFSRLTYKDTQERREKALNVNKEDIISAAKYLLDQKWYSFIYGNRSVSEVPKDFTIQPLE